MSRSKTHSPTRPAHRPTSAAPRPIRAAAAPDLIYLSADDAAPVSIVEAAAGAAGDPPPQRTFSGLAYTGGKLEPLAGFGVPVVVDLSGLRVSAKSRPILRDHSPGAIVGHTTEIAINDGSLRVAGVISGANAHAEEVVAAGKAGFPWQMSIGVLPQQLVRVDVGETVQINGRSFRGPLIVARRGVLREISFVALGADDNTSAKVAAISSLGVRTMNFADWLKAQGFEEQALSAAQRASLQAMYDAQLAASGSGDDQADAADDAAAAGPAGGSAAATRQRTNRPARRTPVQAAAGTAGAQAADATDSTDELEPPDAREARLLASIDRRIAERYERAARIDGLCAGRHPQIAAQALAENWSADRVELEVLRAERGRPTGIHVADRDRTGEAIEASLCLAAGLTEQQLGAWYPAQVIERARRPDMRGASIGTVLFDVIGAAGMHVRPGRITDQVVRTAFDAERTLRAAGGLSTVSLSGILGNTANKALLASYLAVPRASTLICEQTGTNDFKQFSRYRMTAAGTLVKVGPSGELTHAELSEQGFTNQLDTFGRIIALNRQQMLNDDLSAFLQLPRLLGRMSALALEEAVFTLLLANPANFFAAGNKNTATGAGTALSITSLSQAEQLFLDQQDAGGKPVVLEPAVLLVGTALKTTAEGLFKEAIVNEATATAKPRNNPHVGKFTPATTPYLNSAGIPNANATRWYLFADPQNVAAMQVAYLGDRREPTIESADTDFNTLGMQWRCYFDFGVAMQDPRAAVYMTGA